MTVIVFLIDNSATMCQRTYLGTSLLDIAKAAVESFCKIRQKLSRSDRYYIFSLDKEPNELKSYEPKLNPSIIRQSMDGIKPHGYKDLGVGIKKTFDLLNLMRMSNGLENYGMGRFPSQIENAIVICITDGGLLTSERGVCCGELTLPVINNQIQSNELTLEPFRWDYKFYSIVLRFPAFLPQPIKPDLCKFIPTDETCPIRSMCEVTGGRAYKITNERTLNQCLESLSQKCSPGVVLHFRKLEDLSVDGQTAKSEAWHNCKKMIYVKSSSVGATASSHWPIPESYWPDEHVINDKLPPRCAHPIVCFSTQKMPPPRIMEHFPLDRYELEPSPLTQYMLERHETNYVWHCYVPKSGKQQDYPFGYLKPSHETQSVYLYVMSYNFPALIDLLSTLLDTFKMRVNDGWGAKFAHYLGIIPKYYFAPLARAFEKIGLPHLIKPDLIERYLPFSLKSTLQKMRQQAKIILEMEQKNQNNHQNESKYCILPKPNGTTVKINHINFRLARTDISSYYHARTIPRREMRNMAHKCRINLLRYMQSRHIGAGVVATATDFNLPMNRECVNEQPMCQMGDYNNYRYRIPSGEEPLREIHPLPERKDTFGNPFRRKSSSLTPAQISAHLMYPQASPPAAILTQGAASASSASSSPQNNASFEADERFVDESCPGSPVQSALSSSPVVGSSRMSDTSVRMRGRLPLNVTCFNWRSGSSCSSVSSSRCSSPAPDSGMGEEDDTHSNGIAETPSLQLLPTDDTIDTFWNNNTTSWNDQQLSDIYHHNKYELGKLTSLLRHPKLNGSTLFDVLVNFQGPYKMQQVMISRAISSARKFKRHDIAQLMQQYLCYIKNNQQPCTDLNQACSNPSDIVNQKEPSQHILHQIPNGLH